MNKKRATVHGLQRPTLFQRGKNVPFLSPISVLLVLAASASCLGSAGRSYSPENERAYAEYAAGVYAEAGKENELALQHYRRAASSMPQSPGVAAKLGAMYLQANNPQEAQRYLVRASSLDPENIGLKVHAAQACTLAGSPREGIKYLEEILRKEPSWSEGYRQVAELYKRLGMWASAADAYARLAKLPGLRPVACERLGDMYLDLGRRHARSRQLYGQILSFRRALRWFDEIGPSAPGGQSVLLGRAECYRGTFQFDKAAEQCEKYLVARPKDIAARRFLAQIQKQSGDLEKATSTYEQIIKANPQFFRTHVEFVEVLLERDLFRRAAAAAENFAAAFPKEMISNFLAGQCLVFAGDPAGARIYLEKVIELGSDRKTRNGKPAFKETLKEAVFLLGMICLRDGDDEKAMRYFGRTLALDPEDASANNNLGYLTLENGGDLKSALRLIRRAVRIRPRCGEFLDSLGWAYFKMGRTEEAITRLNEATKFSRQPEIYDHLGQAYQSMGRIQEARKEWKKSLRIDPEYQPARERLQESYGLEEQV